MLKPIVFKNGLTVLRLSKPTSNIVIVGFIASTGFNVESNFFPRGISQLTERLFWCGNDKYQNTRQLDLHLESIGGYFTSWTSYDFTHFYITVPSYHQFKACILLADIIQHSFFSPGDLETEKQKLLQQITSKGFQDQNGTNQFVVSELVGDENLGLSLQGTQNSVLSISQEDVLEYLSHQYRPDKSYLVLAGNIEEQLLEVLEQEWNFWNPKNKPHISLTHLEKYNWQPSNLPRIVYRQRSSLGTEILLIFPIPRIKDLIYKFKFGGREQLQPLRSIYGNNIYYSALEEETENYQDPENPNSKIYPTHLKNNSLSSLNSKSADFTTNLESIGSYSEFLQTDSEENKPEIITQNNNPEVWQAVLEHWAKMAVLNSILGQGISSRLWTKGVEEEILFSHISSEIIRYKNLSYLQIRGLTDNSQFSFGLESILSVLESFKKTTVSINEISRAKEYLKGSLILENEDLLNNTVWHLDILLNHNIYFNLVDLLEFIQKVQAPELRALACDIFTVDNLLLAILGSTKETRLVSRLVNKYLG